MKRILKIAIAVLLALNTSAAFADTCATSLMPAFTANQAVGLCKTFGAAVNHSLIPSVDNTYDLGSATFGWRSVYADTSVLTPLIIPPATLTLQLAADANRLVTFTGTSDTQSKMTWGDGTTAAQVFSVLASSADSADDGSLILGGGGSSAAGRGAFSIYYGNDVATVGGAMNFTTGDASGADINLQPIDAVVFKLAQDANRLISTSSASDIAFSTVFGDATDSQVWEVMSGSLDTDDNDLLCLSGGGDCADATRGGYANLGGADVGGANAGDVTIGATDDFFVKTGVAGVTALTIDESQAITIPATLVSSSTTTLGWTVKASGAGVTCEAACTSACVAGQNATFGLEPCSVAVTGLCICAGAS